jgi:hypothetical protein
LVPITKLMAFSTRFIVLNPLSIADRHRGPAARSCPACNGDGRVVDLSIEINAPLVARRLSLAARRHRQSKRHERRETGDGKRKNPASAGFLALDRLR